MLLLLARLLLLFFAIFRELFLGLLCFNFRLSLHLLPLDLQLGGFLLGLIDLPLLFLACLFLGERLLRDIGGNFLFLHCQQL